jgi:uncharacterized protein YyaL (SSP411 family)
VPNRLAQTTSPYLLQHADNPVDWHPWGDEAFDEARRRDVPVFLSVGYSSCHWCHVMAHESFEDDELAAYMNAHFVNVKVDREERPDVDAVYMAAVQGMTGRGGWPMSVFLDHDRRPFYAGTYWPRRPRGGMPAFPQVLQAITDAWDDRRDEVVESAKEITEALAGAATATAEESVDLSLSAAAVELVVDKAWDRERGGFGRPPKFPQAMTIGLLLDHHARTGHAGARDAAVHALQAMARGGIHDQVAGGFARYSTDADWLVPHFEKMLYDNGLLLDVYARAAALTGDVELERVARSTADYLVREMQHDAGGFFSATDADSEGVEGKFFVWTDEEFREVCDEAGVDPDRYAAFHGVRPDGNFRPEAAGHAPDRANILHEPVDRATFADQHGLDRGTLEAELRRLHIALYDRRADRVPPGLDDKVLTSWNALAIRGLARAALHLGEPRYADAAVRAATFLRDHAVVDGRLHHTWKDGTAAVPAFLEDVAGLAAALPWLAAATGDPSWSAWAVTLADDAVSRFADPDGGYFQTADDAEVLVTRPKDAWDNATPAGTSLLAQAAWQLALLTGEARWEEVAGGVVRSAATEVRRAPTGFGELLQVVEALAADGREVAVVGAAGEARDALVAAAVGHPRPGLVAAVAAPDDPAAADVPLLRDRPTRDGAPTAYVCRGFVCDAPTTDPAAVAAAVR